MRLPRNAPTSPIDAFLAAGASGHGGLGPTLAGIAAAFLAQMIGAAAGRSAAAALGWTSDAGAWVGAFAGIAAEGIAVFWIVATIHGRALGPLFGAAGVARIVPFARGLGVGAAATGATTLGFWLFGWVAIAPRAEPPTPEAWAVLGALLALTPLAAAAEEVLCRGYLAQCAHRWPRRPPLYALPGLLVFALLHFEGDLAQYMTALPFVLAFGVMAAASVARTGGLYEAIGLHIGWNMIAIFVFAPPDAPPGVGLFSATTLSAPPIALVIGPAALLVGHVWLAGGARRRSPRKSQKWPTR